MDPNAAKNLILAYLSEGEPELARGILEDLCTWLQWRGFEPMDAEWKASIRQAAPANWTGLALL